MTTIKLTYWAALTVFELALPHALERPIEERLPVSYGVTAALSALAVLWAVLSARAVDRRAGGLSRSLPTVATTFIAASVVASPASLPLLLIERARSVEGCVAPATCHLEAIALWVAMFAIGLVVIPAAFALALRAKT
ncbi:MAG: hypothetical protein ACRDF0_08970 [Candidatus Limnocylindria bacterium]